jgi:hypothetical protein
MTLPRPLLKVAAGPAARAGLRVGDLGRGPAADHHLSVVGRNRSRTAGNDGQARDQSARRFTRRQRGGPARRVSPADRVRVDPTHDSPTFGPSRPVAYPGPRTERSRARARDGPPSPGRARVGRPSRNRLPAPAACMITPDRGATGANSDPNASAVNPSGQCARAPFADASPIDSVKAWRAPPTVIAEDADERRPSCASAASVTTCCALWKTERVIVLALLSVIFVQSASIARDVTDSSDCSVGAEADQIAHRFNTLMGIEESRGCESPAWHGRDSQQDIVATMSLREAMDDLVARAPTYRWRVIGDVVVLRPGVAWDDPSNPLHQMTRAFDVRGASLRTALHLVLDDPHALQFVEHTDLPATFREDRSHVSVLFPGGTLLQALTSIIRAHGSATWRLGYDGNRAFVTLSALDFQGPVAMEPVAVPVQ